MADVKKTVEEVQSLLEETEKMRGLGDAVARVTKKLGMHECGKCQKRREKLNRLVPFKKS